MMPTAECLVPAARVLAAVLPGCGGATHETDLEGDAVSSYRDNGPH
jgi:hypothetical protein